VRIASGDKAFFDDDLGVAEPRLEIAVFPALRRLAERQLGVARLGEIAGVPLDRLEIEFDVGDVASAAVSSSTAATARVGAPTKSGSFERIGSCGGGN